MFDTRMRRLIDPPLNASGRWLAARGVSANAVTLAGALVGIVAGVAAWQGAYGVALALILLNRLGDGIDGAIARAAGKTPFGGYLDILCDFAFYVAVPLGFGLGVAANLAPALVLVGCFTLTGVSFLAFASIAAGRGLATTAHGEKSFFYSTGLAEGTETIVAFAAMCVWPQHFAVIAYAYAVLCGLTVVQRSAVAWRVFR